MVQPELKDRKREGKTGREKEKETERSTHRCFGKIKQLLTRPQWLMNVTTASANIQPFPVEEFWTYKSPVSPP